MAGLIDVGSLIDDLLREGIAPEELIVESIRELHYLEDYPPICYSIGLKNRIRTIIAHSKILYDFGKKMQLARVVLLHRVKLLEVRDENNKIEISVLRGSSSGEDPSRLDARLDDVSLMEPAKQTDYSRIERAIIDCADMVRTLEASERSLRNLGTQIAEGNSRFEEAMQMASAGTLDSAVSPVLDGVSDGETEILL